MASSRGISLDEIVRTSRTWRTPLQYQPPSSLGRSHRHRRSGGPRRGLRPDGDRRVGGDQGGGPRRGAGAARRRPGEGCLPPRPHGDSASGLPGMLHRMARVAPAAAAAASGVDQPVLAVDGKTLRRSHDRKNGLGTLHSVSIWASEYGLTLGQVACAEKSNEITAIPELLRLVDIKGAIITIDAMGAQKAIAAEVIRGKADYVLALKGNQETLHQAVIDHVGERLEGDDVGIVELVVREQGHGREEERTYLQLPVPEDLPGKSQWKGLKSIGVVTSLPPRRQGERRGALLHQQPGRRCEAIRSRRAIALGHREHVSLDPRCDLSRGRVADSRAVVAGELRVAESADVVAAEATSGQREHRQETPGLRMVRQVLDGSPYRDSTLVGAGPDICCTSKRPAKTLPSPKRCSGK